ncbi:hypothetical protein QT995_25235 [Microcoleus sp. S36b_A3]|uniref:hypothetical protein n=1 Tax=unclassified Microcoleus TaxID=2642155 RepID=UPI002FCFE7D7
MVETGGDPGHERARHTYEKAGFELFPVARYFKKLACANVKSQGLLGSLWAIALVPILRLDMIREGSASSKRQSCIGAVGCDIRLMLDKTDIEDIIIISKSDG